MKLIVCRLAKEGSVKVCLSPSHPYDRVSTQNGPQAQLSCFPVVWCVPNQGSVLAANVFISARSTGCEMRRRGRVGRGLHSLEEIGPGGETGRSSSCFKSVSVLLAKCSGAVAEPPEWHSYGDLFCKCIHRL